MSCLSKDPAGRMTAEDALNHQWLLGNCSEPEISKEAANEIIEDMAAFCKQNVFQTGVVSLLSAHKIQSNELMNLKKMFLRLDKSRDGFLTLEELQKGMCEVQGVIKVDSQDW